MPDAGVKSITDWTLSEANVKIVLVKWKERLFGVKGITEKSHTGYP
jgi:hypothetical protein